VDPAAEPRDEDATSRERQSEAKQQEKPERSTRTVVRRAPTKGSRSNSSGKKFVRVFRIDKHVSKLFR
jgi:hypothetical protein